MEMNNILVMGSVGFLTFIVGILLLKREIKMVKEAVITTAKVVTYYDYRDTDDARITMYTMAIEYKLEDGTLVHARERSGASSQKYPIGTEIKIAYNRKKPDFFNIYGDNSRKNIMIGMIIVGFAIMVLCGYGLLQNYTN
jgi:hypothetical protein